MNQPSNSPIDLDQLNQISLGDIGFEIEVLQVYVEDVMPRIVKAREAIANNDFTQVVMSAHHIKGASSNVGASQILDLAIEIEELDRHKTPEKFLKILDNMLEKMKDIEEFITQKSMLLAS